MPMDTRKPASRLLERNVDTLALVLGLILFLIGATIVAVNVIGGLIS